ncbi:spermidine synthase [Boudabousia marimammalium]|uniref:Spermidine synthase n=1 Tax=Boudabousia marimammalium TaxID=156892 RepID=A0A1Q5PNV1_9ACTO|nr:fused MFS/spermidine synthase [Boudabousia marimammalium]OKL49251.1 hypothetical protein BM477_04490 [Boudabousia marimammalium]
MPKSRSKNAPNLRQLPVEPVQIDSGKVQLRRVDNGIMVVINNAESSMIDLTDPTYLEFEYMQHMTILTHVWRSEPTAITALHLGGGACSLARAWAHLRPGSKNKVVEVDGKLATLVREWFDLPSAPAVSIRVGDARVVAEQLRDGSYDVIVRDVFAGIKTPLTVSSTEATGHYARVLQNDGLFLANIAATPGDETAAREFRTIAEHFPYLVAVSSPKVARGQRRGNIVVAASRVPFDLDAVDVELRRCPLPVSRVDSKTCKRWLRTELLLDPPREESS